MFQLIYTSRPSAALSEQAIQSLLEGARRDNKAADVTGVMILGENRLLQVLEGQENRVRTLYRRILQDDRHIDCELLLARNSPNRSFGAWAMGVCRSGDEDYKLKIVIAELRKHRDRVTTLHSDRVQPKF